MLYSCTPPAYHAQHGSEFMCVCLRSCHGHSSSTLFSCLERSSLDVLLGKQPPRAPCRQHLLQEGGTAPSLGCPRQQGADADRAGLGPTCLTRGHALSLWLSSQHRSVAKGHGDCRAHLMATWGGSLAARAALAEDVTEVMQRPYHAHAALRTFLRGMQKSVPGKKSIQLHNCQPG